MYKIFTSLVKFNIKYFVVFNAILNGVAFHVFLDSLLLMYKNIILYTAVEDSWESLLDYKEIKPVSLKGNQPQYSLEVLLLKLKF